MSYTHEVGGSSPSLSTNSLSVVKSYFINIRFNCKYTFNECSSECFGSVTRDGIWVDCKSTGLFHGEFESLTAHNIVKASRFL